MQKNLILRCFHGENIRKIFLRMKLVTFLIAVSIFSVSAKSYSQPEKLTLKFKEVTLNQVLTEIEKNSDYIFIFNEKTLDVNRTVNINVKDEGIEAILDEIVAGTETSYKIFGRQILIIELGPTKVNLDSENLMDFTEVSIEDEAPQQISVAGKVIDSKGEPIIGVTVQVKGTTIGFQTDINGKYTLSNISKNAILTFSFIGMETQEIPLNGRISLDIVMRESVLTLDEVVVVGYGVQKKITVTGAVVSVTGDALVASPNSAVTNTLAGRVTGLATVQYSGQPGSSDPNIYVRGVGSLTESASRPLMLVDGVERSFAQMDPNEIESISVLKDASATAVYGIRGANGVIIVTTKRGVEGAPRISITSSAGLQMPTTLVEMADSYTYAQKYNEAQLNDNPNAHVKFSPFATEAFRTGKYPLIFPNTNWSKELIKPAALQNQHNINISGGSTFVKYFVSFGYLNQDGLFKTFDSPNSYSFAYNRYNYRANIDLDLTKTTKFSITMGGRSENRQQAGSPPSDGIWSNLYWAVPYSGVLNNGQRILIGNSYIAGTEAHNKDGLNAISWGSGYQRALTNIMNLDIGLTQKLDFITEGLSWRFKFSNNTTAGHTKTRSTTTETYDPFFKCDVDPTAPGDSTVVFRMEGTPGVLGYSESSSKARDWYLETALAYEHNYGNHHLTALLLYNESKRFYPGTNSDIPMGYVGMAARATYDYSSKYLVDFNLGYNGSENFAPGKRFGVFPSGSVGWVMSEESFMKNTIPFINFLKFRVSYGVVGNDNQGSSRFLYLPNSYNINTGIYGYNFGTISDLLQKMALEGKVGNPDVTWEKAGKQNYGMDIRILESRLSINVDVFNELRNNILTTLNTPPGIIAITLPAMNVGKVQNHGYEAELKWRDKIGKLNYYLTTNLSFARNKILFMDEIPPHDPYLAQTGQSVNARFGYVFDRFWTSDDISHLQDFPDHLIIPQPGDAKYEDLNGDNVINGYDQKVVGYPDYPEYNFSVSGGIDYKGFDLSFLWNGVTNVSRLLTDTWRTPFGGTGDRGLLQWTAENAWTPENATTAQAPRMSFNAINNNTRVSGLWLRDASYLRLKNMEIGYSFSVAKLRKLGISTMRVSATGYDLITITKLKMMDPEQGWNYPLIKIFNLGLNVTF